MTQKSVVALVRSLTDAGVRYLIVGGLAVNAHGYGRLTKDVDIVLDMDDENLRKAVAALAALGYRPMAPVPIEQFADSDRRREWIHEKGLIVFTLFNASDVKTTLDVFVESPFDFARSYANALTEEIAVGILATFVGFEDLIAMKRASGRSQDLADIDQLEELQRVRDDDARRGPDDADRVQEDLWPRGWEGHRRAQLRRMASIPLPEQIAWLEEAQDLFKKRD